MRRETSHDSSGPQEKKEAVFLLKPSVFKGSKRDSSGTLKDATRLRGGNVKPAAQIRSDTRRDEVDQRRCGGRGDQKIGLKTDNWPVLGL